MGWSEDFPQYGQVEEVLLFKSKTYLKIRKLETLWYSPHIIGYHIGYTEDDIGISIARLENFEMLCVGVSKKLYISERSTPDVEIHFDE